jgi:type IV secretion system protein VirD4
MTRKKGASAPLDDNTLLLAFGAGLVAAVVGAALLAGPLAALLSGKGWPAGAGHPGETAVIALTEGPAAAYTPAPPAAVFYPLLGLLAILLITLALKGLAWLNRSGRTGGAQWGGEAVERKLAVPQDPAQRANRITAGRGMETGKILAAEPHISATVFGVPGKHKTVGVVLPNAAEWRGPLVVTTVKAADLDVIYARRRALGPVWVIAPAGLPGRTTHHWSPVDYCDSPKAADRMAAWQAEAAASGDKRSEPWVDQAKSVLKGILLASQLSGGGIGDMRRWIGLGKDAVDHVRAVLLRHGYTDVAEDYAGPWLRLHDDGVGSVQFSLNVLSRVFADEEVRETCSSTDFSVDELLDQCGTVCLVASQGDAERLAPLLTSIIASIIHGAEARYNATGRPLDPGLGIMVDEAGNMLRYPRLPNVLTTGRGQGITMLTVWHDLSQLRDKLGQQKAGTVMSASGLRMLLPGCGDLETLRYFSQLYGRSEVWRTSHGTGRGGSSTNTQQNERDLAPIHSLQQMADLTAIAQYSNLPPAKVHMRATYRDEDLKKYLAAAPAPASAAAALDKPLIPHPRPAEGERRVR